MSTLSGGLQQHVQPTRSANSAATRIFRIVALVATSLAGAFVFTARIRPASMDYIQYWCSGQLLIHRADPYSPAAVFALEKAHGFLLSSPLIMPNPPWSLFLIAPLGFASIRVALFFWTLIVAGCILASARMVNPDSIDNHFALLFAPAIACIGSGQSSPFLLLGFALFLRSHRDRPFLAGASLLLMSIKPHLFLVFWAVLLVDSIYRRKYLILAGGVSALAAGTAFAMCFDPHIWQLYFAMLSVHHPAEGFLPTLSEVFRLLIDGKAFWLLFVPSAVAVLWGLWYFSRMRHVWDWRVHGMLVMLVTVLVSPYGFFTDEIVLLPSIIFALNFAGKRKYSGWVLLAINGIAALVFMAGASLTSPAYLWTPLAWLGWFLYATYFPGHRDESTAVRFAGTPQTGQVG